MKYTCGLAKLLLIILGILLVILENDTTLYKWLMVLYLSGLLGLMIAGR